VQRLGSRLTDREPQLLRFLEQRGRFLVGRQRRAIL